MRMRVRLRSLPARIAVFSSLVAGLCVLSTAILFGALQQKQMEAQVVEEGMHYAERFTTWTLGYFYQQDNLLHLETQQRFLSESPNIVYSYIVKGTGEIDVGIQGVNSPDVGRRKQPWEDALPVRLDGTVSAKFRADDRMAQAFPEKVQKGEEVFLVGFPVSCPERETPCAQLRVALVAQTAKGIAGRLTSALLGFGFFTAVLSGIAVFVTARRQVQPLRRMTLLMERAKEGGDAAVETVRASLGETDPRESTELASLRSSLRAYLDTLEIAASHEAVARTTQALAHDVRKPFSMLNSIIHSVESAESDAFARRFLIEALPEVRLAVASVEGLILDVMQIGATTTSVLENASPEELIAATLSESFRLNPRSEAEVVYDFQHTHLARVDAVRIGRVFGNLFDNALQAMGVQGRLWIRTRERLGLVEFCIGNSGSFISPEHLPRVFDAFFTQGKKGGTGLGLAVAKRIVHLHGGSIECRSVRSHEAPDGIVEFVFSLPASDAMAKSPSFSLPTTAKAYREQPRLQASFAARVALGEEQTKADELESKIQSALQSAPGEQGVVSVLLVDDEAVYRNGLLALVQQSVTLAERVKVHYACSAQEALAFVEGASQPPHLLIHDVDLGPHSQGGLEVVRELRSRGFEGFVCVHSNRFLSTHDDSAQKAGADKVLPKPMSRAQLLSLLLQALQKSQKKALPEIAYVDDALSFLVGMRVKVKGRAVLHEFRSPSALLQKVDSQPAFLPRLQCIITDFHFGAGEELDGVAFAKELRARGFTRPILLASGTVAEVEWGEGSALSGRLEKPLSDWSQLEPWTL